MTWSQQGVVKEVVFTNGKQDSKTTIVRQALLPSDYKWVSLHSGWSTAFSSLMWSSRGVWH